MIVDGYVRVSRVEGRRGTKFISPAVQREQIERWARGHGALIDRVFEELDESGGRADRPLLLEAIRRVEEGESEGVVVAYMSRFGRSLADGLAAIKRITDAGGAFVSVQEGVDFGTDAGRLLLRLLLSIAEWELDRFRDQWRVASERAVARGRYIGGAPFGYKRGKDGRLRVDPREGPVITELFRRRAEGAQFVELTRWLRQCGVPPQITDKWHRGAAKDMIRKRLYLGESKYGDAINPTAHTALVDPVTWQRAQFFGLRTPRAPQRACAAMGAGALRIVPAASDLSDGPAWRQRQHAELPLQRPKHPDQVPWRRAPP